MGEISKIDLRAREQGAAFMLNCLKSLLNSTNEKRINIDEKPFSIGTTVNEMKILFSPFGQSHILVHLDEHRHMYKHMSDTDISSEFRNGALQVLGKVDGVTPVATFTGMPQLLPEQSSEVCRYPLRVPPLDLDLVTKDIEELKLPAYDKDDNEQRRTWSTLCFRLRLKIRQMDYLHVGNTSFLQDFKKAASGQVVQRALENCIKLCPFYIPREYNDNENALKLLVGIQETDLKCELERQIKSMLVVGRLVTCSLECLLSSDDPNFPIYDLGRDRLEKILTSPETIDFISQTPLEAAYSWLLSCRSAMKKKLKIGAKTWQIECNDLQPYRLFNGHDDTDYAGNFKNMKCDTIYYVEEGKGNMTHPLCDILFRTKNELVLIDVTGGEKNTVAKKVNELSTWIAREG